MNTLTDSSTAVLDWSLAEEPAMAWTEQDDTVVGCSVRPRTGGVRWAGLLPDVPGRAPIHRVHGRGPHPEQDLPRSPFRRRCLARCGASRISLTVTRHRHCLGLLSRPRAAEVRRAGWRRPPCRRPPTPR